MATGNENKAIVSESQPPTYEQAIEPPPSYQSLFGEIKDVRKKSSNVGEFLIKLIILLGSTIGVAIFFGILLAIPITMIVLGAKYKDDCPREDYIPIYLIVMGSFLIFRKLSSLCSQVSSSNEDENDDEKNPAHKCCDSVVDLFLFCWFITGNYWIYHIYKPSYDVDDGDEYCHKTLYLFSFWLMNATYIMIGVMCCCTTMIGCCAVCVQEDEES